MALEDPAAAEAHGGEHLLTGVTDGVAEHHVPPEAVADLWQVGARPSWKPRGTSSASSSLQSGP